MTLIENKIPGEEYYTMENLPKTNKSKMLTILLNVGKPDMVEKFIDTICEESILETSEGIIDFLELANLNIKNISKKSKLDHIQIGLLYKALYTVFIPWKITANVIAKTASSDIRPDDRNLFLYSNNINKILFSEIAISKEPTACALIIHSLMESLGIDIKNKNAIEFFINGVKYYNNVNSSAVSQYLKKFCEGKGEPLSVIDMVSTVELGNSGENLLNFTKRKIEENYIKGKISKEVNNQSLCIGEDVFPDHEPLNVGNLMIELEKLSDEEIKNYIGEEKNIVYTLDPNDCIYIKDILKAPMCKVFRKDVGFNTLSKIEGISVLLFKIYGEDSVYGISFPVSNGGIRKLIQINTTMPRKKIKRREQN